MISSGSSYGWEQLGLHPGISKVAANCEDRNCRIVCWFVGRVKVRVSRVVKSDKFQLRVQAWRARRASLSIDLVVQSGRIRVQASRSAKGQLKGAPSGCCNINKGCSRSNPSVPTL